MLNVCALCCTDNESKMEMSRKGRIEIDMNDIEWWWWWWWWCAVGVMGEEEKGEEVEDNRHHVRSATVVHKSFLMLK